MFENVNGRRTDDEDGRRIHGYPISSLVRLRLRLAKNSLFGIADYLTCFAASKSIFLPNLRFFFFFYHFRPCANTGLPHYNAIFGVHRNRPCYNEVIYIRTIGK